VLLAVPADNIGGDSSRREDDATQRQRRWHDEEVDTEFGESEGCGK